MDGETRNELIVVFHNTREAVMAEHTLLTAGVDVRVMPMPAQLGSACGIALRLAPPDIRQAGSLLGDTIAGIYRRSPEIPERFIAWNP